VLSQPGCQSSSCAAVTSQPDGRTSCRYTDPAPRRYYAVVLAIKGKGSPYSIAERRVLELITVLGSQPVGDVSDEPGGRLPLLSVRPAVTLATLKRAATNFAAW